MLLPPSIALDVILLDFVIVSCVIVPVAGRNDIAPDFFPVKLYAMSTSYAFPYWIAI